MDALGCDHKTREWIEMALGTMRWNLRDCERTGWDGNGLQNAGWDANGLGIIGWGWVG